MPTTHTAQTAVRKLELSRLKPEEIQQELMGDDLDLEKMVVYLKSKILFDTTDRIIDVQVERSIDAASTITVTLNDYDRTILRSGALNARLDVKLDGMWFRLVKVSRSAGSDTLELQFEQREIAILRSYPKQGAKHNGVRFVHRDKVTRAQFILSLIREVKELDIPVVMPHLRQAQVIEKESDVGFDWGKPKVAAESAGINTDHNTTVGAAEGGRVGMNKGVLTSKGVRMSREQINNANTIIATGLSLKARRKVLVCAVMTAMQESNLINLPGGDGTSVGLFQQIDTGWGSYADRHNPATAAKSFFNRAIPHDKNYPGLSFNDLCQGIQGSGHPDLYGQWQPESQAIVTAYGVPPSTSTSGQDDTTEGSAASANNHSDISFGGTEDYVYYRGKQKESGKVWEREDNW